VLTVLFLSFLVAGPPMRVEGLKYVFKTSNMVA
jgi:hypothetical protein